MQPRRQTPSHPTSKLKITTPGHTTLKKLARRRGLKLYPSRQAALLDCAKQHDKWYNTQGDQRALAFTARGAPTPHRPPYPHRPTNTPLHLKRKRWLIFPYPLSWREIPTHQRAARPWSHRPYDWIPSQLNTHTQAYYDDWNAMRVVDLQDQQLGSLQRPQMLHLACRALYQLPPYWISFKQRAEVQAHLAVLLYMPRPPQYIRVDARTGNARHDFHYESYTVASVMAEITHHREIPAPYTATPTHAAKLKYLLTLAHQTLPQYFDFERATSLVEGYQFTYYPGMHIAPSRAPAPLRSQIYLPQNLQCLPPQGRGTTELTAEHQAMASAEVWNTARGVAEAAAHAAVGHHTTASDDPDTLPPETIRTPILRNCQRIWVTEEHT